MNMYNFFSELHEFVREVWGTQHFQSPSFSSLCCLHLAYAERMCREFHGAFSPKWLHWWFWLKQFSLAGWLGSSTLHGCSLLPLTPWMLLITSYKTGITGAHPVLRTGWLAHRLCWAVIIPQTDCYIPWDCVSHYLHQTHFTKLTLKKYLSG